MLSKLQERAKTREQQSLANKKRSDVQDTKTGEEDGVGKTKRKHEKQENEKKQLKKKKKESNSEQDDVDETPAEATDLGTSEQSRKKKKKKDKQGSGNQEEKQHTGSCSYACITNFVGNYYLFLKLSGCHRAGKTQIYCLFI